MQRSTLPFRCRKDVEQSVNRYFSVEIGVEFEPTCKGFLPCVFFTPKLPDPYERFQESELPTAFQTKLLTNFERVKNELEPSLVVNSLWISVSK